ncbi:unnamed protein product [Nippostrongylus brasiliensis]|uniref:Uncharacterized protein n=1 Tax=Nippostrongylus brasiliensis TaxID=27835 RepID=A0A0N4YCB4_NIPBR|nr:unnamed protein product [Nippostrongylus brasiliensis]
MVNGKTVLLQLSGSRRWVATEEMSSSETDWRTLTSLYAESSASPGRCLRSARLPSVAVSGSPDMLSPHQSVSIATVASRLCGYDGRRSRQSERLASGQTRGSIAWKPANSGSA